jgi:selenide,water dikinase
VRELVDEGPVPGGTARNLDAAASSTDFEDPDDTTHVLVCDAQTSGGLLAACDPGVVDRVLEGEPAAVVIGRIVDGPAGRIAVRGRVG